MPRIPEVEEESIGNDSQHSNSSSRPQPQYTEYYPGTNVAKISYEIDPRKKYAPPSAPIESDKNQGGNNDPEIGEVVFRSFKSLSPSPNESAAGDSGEKNENDELQIEEVYVVPLRPATIEHLKKLANKQSPITDKKSSREEEFSAEQQSLDSQPRDVSLAIPNPNVNPPLTLDEQKRYVDFRTSAIERSVKNTQSITDDESPREIKFPRKQQTSLLFIGSFNEEKKDDDSISSHAEFLMNVLPFSFPQEESSNSNNSNLPVKSFGDESFDEEKKDEDIRSHNAKTMEVKEIMLPPKFPNLPERKKRGRKPRLDKKDVGQRFSL